MPPKLDEKRLYELELSSKIFFYLSFYCEMPKEIAISLSEKLVKDLSIIFTKGEPKNECKEK